MKSNVSKVLAQNCSRAIVLHVQLLLIPYLIGQCLGNQVLLQPRVSIEAELRVTCSLQRWHSSRCCGLIMIEISHLGRTTTTVDHSTISKVKVNNFSFWTEERQHHNWESTLAFNSHSLIQYRGLKDLGGMVIKISHIPKSDQNI